MILPAPSRPSLLKASVAIAVTAPLTDGLLAAEGEKGVGPLIAYVGTFSSPLRDVLPTQVDLPPGNGRGISSICGGSGDGAMTAAGVHAIGRARAVWRSIVPGRGCIRRMRRIERAKNKEGTDQRVCHQPGGGELELLCTMGPRARAGPTYVSIHPSGRLC